MMSLHSFPKILNSQLADLIIKFNTIAEKDHIQRLFYLQKIDYYLTTYTFNDALFAWVSANEWKECLRSYEVIEYASFFLKSFQFAQAIAKNTPANTTIKPASDMYLLLQARDKLLKENEYEACKDNYLTLSLQLNQLAQENEIIRERISNDNKLLQLAKGKIEAIQGKPPAENNIKVTTVQLGSRGNNANFIIKLVDQTAAADQMESIELIGRVEDRNQLRLAHELQSFRVADYLSNDVCVFMMQFKNAHNNYELRPVVFSEKANQGSLDNVAKQLRLKVDGQLPTTRLHNYRKISTQSKHYFMQLLDFIEKLLEVKIYHPDIKLSNFLVHKNLIRISDRKTFLSDVNPYASNMRSTAIFATQEWINCLNKDQNQYAPIARKTRINMLDFMTFQIGMALKQFLILTQTDAVTIDDLRDWNFLRLTRHFLTPSSAIINLCLLAHKLTHPNPKERLSLLQFKTLLLHSIQLPPKDFHEKIREKLPISTLNLADELEEIKALLDKETIDAKELVTKSNLIFARITDKGIDNIELQLQAEKLAAKCYHKYSAFYLTKLFLTNDWNAAPWYRKALYYLSFSLWKLDPAKKLDKSLLSILDAELLPHLKFLPSMEFELIGSVHMHSLYQAIAEAISLKAASEKNVGPKVSETLPLEAQAGKKTDSVKASSEEEAFTSVVFNQKAPNAAPINVQHEDQVVNSHQLPHTKTVSSVNTTMRQGDGSNRRKPPRINIPPAGEASPGIARLWDIFAEIERPQKGEAGVPPANSRTP